MTSPICPRCGKHLPPQSTTCPHCQFALEFAAGEKPERKTPKWVWWVLGFALACPCGIGLVATLVVQNVLQRLAMATRGKAKADITAIEQAVDEYALNNGMQYPDSLDALVQPDINGQTFLKQTKIYGDPWGRAYLYSPPGPSQPRPRIYTLGKDGRIGGEGEDADIDNATFEAGIVPNVLHRLRPVTRTRDRADIVLIEQALDEYAINNGMKYPDTLDVLVRPDVNGETYLKVTRIPIDPWGRTYLYTPPTPGQPRPLIYTLGKDGKPGGEGDDADISNETIREDG